MKSESEIKDLLDKYEKKYNDIVDAPISTYNESTPYLLKDLRGNITALKWVLR